MPEYSPKQLLSLYKQLPKELKEALNAEETETTIQNVSKEHGLSSFQISKLAEAIRNVLMGLLPPDEFQENLEKELKLEKEVAKKISFEINRFIFFPVREFLSALYKMEISPPAMPKREEKPKKEDIYREPIE